MLDIKFDERGLVPAIVQDYRTKEVLMLAYMNKESLDKTIKTGKTCFYSRSRKTLWEKGETSGHTQYVKSISVDCDNDTLLISVEQVGDACHTGEHTCFYRNLDGEKISFSRAKMILDDIYDIVTDRKENPKEGSYTNYLLDKGIDKILKKVGEESAETIIACKNNDKDEIALETSDLFYHLMVMLVDRGLEIDDVFTVLEGRKK